MKVSTNKLKYHKCMSYFFICRWSWQPRSLQNGPARNQTRSLMGGKQMWTSPFLVLSPEAILQVNIHHISPPRSVFKLRSNSILQSVIFFSFYFSISFFAQKRKNPLTLKMFCPKANKIRFEMSLVLRNAWTDLYLFSSKF